MKRSRVTCLVGTLLWFFLFRAGAAIPAPEQLLPQDTLLMVTAPDFRKMREIYGNLPRTKLWEGPAMKPLKERFVSRWQEEFVRPLEHELNVSLDSYSSLPQGQLTFALVQNGWQGTEDHPLGFLLLLDAKDKGALLRTNLAELRRNWVDAGKTVRRENIRGLEFSIFPISSNNLPKTLRKFFPAPYQYQAPPGEVGKPGYNDASSKMGPIFDAISAMLAASSELVVGQIDSLLIVGDSVTSVEKVVTRLTGGAMPPLNDLAAYAASHIALFRNVPFYGWINTKQFVDILCHKPSEKEESETPDPFDMIKPDKALNITGLTGLKSVAFSLQVSSEGSVVQVVATAPASARQGFLKILPGEAKEVVPPAFVPADAVRFCRWRLDGQKTWGALEAMLKEGAPQTLNTLNWILDTANARAKETNPNFDLKKTLVANLGDDLIRYEKEPRDNTAAELAAPPSLVLIGSPCPDLLAVALKGLFVIFPEGDTMSEREFLGRKIFAVPLPAFPVPIPAQQRPTVKRILNFSAGASYVALSTDPGMLEEYLRSAEGLPKALREKPGLLEAAQTVGGPGTSFLGYENQEETMRAVFETVRRDPAAVASVSGLSPLPGLGGLGSPDKNLKGWLDISLLPTFDKVAPYFFFTVYGASANTDGLTLKFFTPTPPALRGGVSSK
jgi:hypothetical protein